MKAPILETERLILRPLTVADAKDIYEKWGTDPEVAKFMMWELHKSIDNATGWLTTVEQDEQSDKQRYNWGFTIKETGELIGSGGLYYKEEHDCLELGYNLMKLHWGKGITTEAGRAMLDYAIDKLSAKKFFCCHAVDNIGSQRVIEKLGFTYISDGSYDSVGGTKHFNSRQYLLTVE